MKIFRCGECQEEFVKQNSITRHRKTHNLKKGRVLILKCDLCERTFDENRKLNAYRKNPVIYKCNQCEKSFICQEIKEKHIQISHKNVKLFCNYFNNYRVCPFEDKYIFLHEESENCKYFEICVIIVRMKVIVKKMTILRMIMSLV